ncbi:DUF6188 family protein [Leucobacter sp. HY1908]
MKLKIEGERIEQVSFDYAVSLLTERDGYLQIETAFSLLESAANERSFFDPESSKEVGRILPFVLHATVTSALVDEKGNLALDFDNGARLEVPYHADYEAWNFVDKSGFRAVVSAGGGLTIWQGED